MSILECHVHLAILILAMGRWANQKGEKTTLNVVFVAHMVSLSSILEDGKDLSSSQIDIMKVCHPINDIT
jgi:hypothetical protein